VAIAFTPATKICPALRDTEKQNAIVKTAILAFAKLEQSPRSSRAFKTAAEKSLTVNGLRGTHMNFPVPSRIYQQNGAVFMLS